MKLNEIRMLSGIHPTDNQKRVLAKIIAAPNSKVAGEDISGDENMIAARNILMKLGVITFSAGAAELTDKGEQIAQDENIADASGQLTDVGNALVSGEEGAPPQQQSTEMPPEQPQEQPGEDPLGLGQQQTGMESFSLLRNMLHEVSHGTAKQKRHFISNNHAKTLKDAKYLAPSWAADVWKTEGGWMCSEEHRGPDVWAGRT
jgi:hypothetical protein